MNIATAERLLEKVNGQCVTALEAEDWGAFHLLFERGQRLHNLISRHKPDVTVPYPAFITYEIGGNRISLPAYPDTIDGLSPPPSCAPAHNLNLYYAACRKATLHAQTGNNEQAKKWQQKGTELLEGLIEAWPIEAIQRGPSSDRKDQ